MVWIKINQLDKESGARIVTTFAVVWIEMISSKKRKTENEVTTFAVVWIEIGGRYNLGGNSCHHLRGGVD